MNYPWSVSVAVLFLVFIESKCALVRHFPEDHSKCGCPAASQRQPRSAYAGRGKTIAPTFPEATGNTSDQERSLSLSLSLSLPLLKARTDRSLTTGRIFNGKASKKGSWPWQVSLQLLHPRLGFIGHWCGGVLIDPKWILTAAHCVHNELFNLPIGALWTVVVGEWELDSGDGGSARLPVDRVFLHERFNNYVHDIALMKLARPAPLSKVVRTICLPRPEEKLGDGRCVTSGWGRYGPTPALSTGLLEATVPLLRLEECQRAYGKSVPIRNGHLCAGNTDGSSGSCVGDSGGPLQCQTSEGVWQLAGITSFGSGCAQPGFPDVYTRIQHYLDWIRSTMNSEKNN